MSHNALSRETGVMPADSGWRKRAGQGTKMSRRAKAGPTLMRSPVVKGHTTPESGFFDFFSAVVEAQRRQPLATCSVFISVWGAPTWLHQTLMEVRAPLRRRVQ